MGKITTNYFLNTNLKPYRINGQDYYAIYIMITAKRKTTKVRSLMFEEYYTQNDFDEIIQSSDIEDVVMRENELCVIDIITDLIISELGDFDTTFFASYLNFANITPVGKCDLEKFKGHNEEEYNSLISARNGNFNITYIKFLVDLGNKETTIYNFFSKEYQKQIVTYLLEEDVLMPINKVLKLINKMVFYSSLEYFKYFAQGGQKTRQLVDLYETLFDDPIFYGGNKIFSE